MVDGDAALRDDVAKEAHRGAAELALRRLGIELVVPKGFNWPEPGRPAEET